MDKKLFIVVIFLMGALAVSADPFGTFFKHFGINRQFNPFPSVSSPRPYSVVLNSLRQRVDNFDPQNRNEFDQVHNYTNKRKFNFNLKNNNLALLYEW